MLTNQKFVTSSLRLWSVPDCRRAVKASTVHKIRHKAARLATKSSTPVQTSLLGEDIPDCLFALIALSSASLSLFLCCNPAEMQASAASIHKNGLTEAETVPLLAHSKHAISPEHDFEQSAANNRQCQKFRTSQASQGEYYGRQKKWPDRTSEPPQPKLQPFKSSQLT